MLEFVQEPLPVVVDTKREPRIKLDCFLYFQHMNYRDYVGQEHEYDFMGASQFSLLYMLGLRACHRLLDFGCGSLRAGRLLIPYLKPGNYHGFDPNSWLIEEAVRTEQVSVRGSVLANSIEELSGPYDYILAHSVFTHTGVDLLTDYLGLWQELLAENGIGVATFYVSEKLSNRSTGWRYPKCFAYTKEYLQTTCQEAGLYFQILDWYHPRQFWAAICKRPIAIELSVGKPVFNTGDLQEFAVKSPPVSYTPQEQIND